MAKRKLNNGDILQIPLPKGMGLGYAKLIDLEGQYEDARYPHLLRVFDYQRTESLEDISILRARGLLFSPLLVSALPTTVSKGIWTVIGNTPVNKEETIIPHYKKFGPPWATEEKDAQQWFYVIDADISQKRRSKYENVKHLETLGADGTGIIETKMAMAFLIQQGKRVEDYFELNEYYEKNTYEKLKSIIPYPELPDNLKDKAIL